MRFTIRHLLFATFIAAFLCGSGLLIYSIKNAAGDDAHFFGVGNDYTVESYSFLLNGEQFEFTEAELDSLESEWQLCCFETGSELYDEINSKGLELQFRCRLSDDYRIESDCKLAEIDGENFLQLELVTTDTGGFQADWNFLRINLENVLSSDRLLELKRFTLPN